MSNTKRPQNHGNQNFNKGSGGRNHDEKPEAFRAEYNYTERFDAVWIQARFVPDCSQHAFEFALYLAKNALTRTQLRNFFGELRRIEARGPAENTEAIAHLQHKLAYTTSRLKQEGKVHDKVAGHFQGVLEKGLKAVYSDIDDMPPRFERFTAYFEAVLAYHRFHGGKES